MWAARLAVPSVHVEAITADGAITVRWRVPEATRSDRIALVEEGQSAQKAAASNSTAATTGTVTLAAGRYLQQGRRCEIVYFAYANGGYTARVPPSSPFEF